MGDNHLKIAAIAGDGIGKEVMPEGMRVLEAVAKRHDIDLRLRRVRLRVLRLLPKAWRDDARRLEGPDRRP